MDKYIVTTTINYPTVATKKFCKIADKKGWKFIVIGDTKTPHEAYFKLQEDHKNFEYINPEEQEKLYPNLSDAIGWKSIQRRNIGLILAYDRGAKIIATIDDDNIPYGASGVVHDSSQGILSQIGCDMGCEGRDHKVEVDRCDGPWVARRH